MHPALLPNYTAANKEQFNKNFIYLKDQESIVQYIDDVCEALNILNGIKYLGCTFEENENSSNLREEKNINISRMNLLTISFEVTGHSNKQKREVQEIIKVPLLFPKTINHFYFIQNGNYYFPIWQIVDKDTYVVGTNERRQLVLKTLLLPIVVRYFFEEFKDTTGGLTLKGRVFNLHLFSKKVNFLYYYIIAFGMEKAIAYFGYQDSIEILEAVDEDIAVYNYVFEIHSKLSVVVSTNTIENADLNFNNFLCSLLNILLETKVKYKNLEETEFWKKKLGSYFTKNLNNQIEKVNSIMLSFERILDNRTKKVLKIVDEDKEDTYSIVRWLIQNYYELSIKDNMDLKNKRLRLYEYMINPLLMKFSKSTYRMLNNKNEKKNTFEQLKSIFSNIKINLIIKKLIQLELLRYNNAVNGMDLFNSALKASFKGPQSMITPGRGSNIGIRYRGLHPSYEDVVSLTFSNAGDPGMTVMFTPFLELEEDFFFDATVFKPSGQNFDESFFENYLEELSYEEDFDEDADDD
jgi:hypothetical protein